MRRRVVPGRPATGIPVRGRGPSGSVALVSMGPQVPTHTYRPRPRGARLAANRVIAAVLCLVLACGAWALLRPDPAPSAAVLSARLADASHRVLRDGDARQAQRLAAAALTARDTPEARSAAMAALAAPLHASTSAPAGDDGAEVVARSGDTVATGGATGVVHVWRVQDVPVGDGVTLARVGGPLPGSDRRVTSLALSADGRALVAGSDDGTARLWSLGDADPGPPRVVRAHGTRVTAVAFVPGGRGRWATAGLDGRLRYWDLRGRPIAGHPGFAPRAGADPVEGITAFAFSGDGQARGRRRRRHAPRGAHRRRRAAVDAVARPGIRPAQRHRPPGGGGRRRRQPSRDRLRHRRGRPLAPHGHRLHARRRHARAGRGRRRPARVQPGR